MCCFQNPFLCSCNRQPASRLRKQGRPEFRPAVSQVGHFYSSASVHGVNWQCDNAPLQTALSRMGREVDAYGAVSEVSKSAKGKRSWAGEQAVIIISCDHLRIRVKVVGIERGRACCEISAEENIPRVIN